MTKVVAAVMLLVAGLTGCGDMTPPDSVTATAVRQFAENEAPAGMEVVELKRDNGWVDTNTQNQYVVKYTYKLRLAKPYADVAIENAKAFEIFLAAKDIQIVASVARWSLWAKTQGEAFKERVTKIVRDCKSCVEYIGQDGDKEAVEGRAISMLIAIYRMEELGFQPEAKRGDAVDRWAQMSFAKTEKGWQALQ